MRKYRDNRLKHKRGNSGAANVDRSDYDDETRAAVEAADAARTAYDEADREVRDAEDKIQALEKTLAQVLQQILYKHI